MLFFLAEAELDDWMESFPVINMTESRGIWETLAVVGLPCAVMELSVAKTCSEDSLVHNPKRQKN